MLRGGGVSKKYRDLEVIFREGQEAKEMYVIKSGRVKITKNVYGIMVKIAVLGQGDFFGEMALLDDAPRSATAIATDPVELAAYDRAALTEEMKTDHTVCFELLRAAWQRLRSIDAEVAKLVAKGRLPKEEAENIAKYGFY